VERIKGRLSGKFKNDGRGCLLNPLLAGRDDGKTEGRPAARGKSDGETWTLSLQRGKWCDGKRRGSRAANSGREGKEYRPDLSKSSKKDRNKEPRARVSIYGGGIRDSKNKGCNADNIGEGNFPRGFLTALELVVSDPGLVPPRTGLGQETVRYFKINFDIVKFMLFVV
jgi:hypothetical protein